MRLTNHAMCKTQSMHLALFMYTSIYMCLCVYVYTLHEPEDSVRPYEVSKVTGYE